MKKLNSLSKTPYKLVTMHGVDSNGTPIYHTNVIMALMDKHIVFCMDSIRDKKERAVLQKELKEGGRQIIDISYKEMNEMCGNMIQLQDSKNGELCVIMSDRARNNLSKSNLKVI